MIHDPAKIIPVKHRAALLFLAIGLVTCQSPSWLSGRLEGMEKNNKASIYLIQPETLQEVGASYFGKVIDSAVVNAEGEFVFSKLPETNEPVLLELVIQPSEKASNFLETEDPAASNYMPILWQPGESVHITARWNEFQKSLSIENPSEVNHELLKLRDISMHAYHTYLEGKNWQTEDGDQLMEKENAVLQYQTALITFADSTPYLLPALIALRWVSPVNNYERVPEFLVRQCAAWSAKEPDHPWVKELCKQSDLSVLPVLLGDVFPDISTPTISGDMLFLKDHLGSRLTIIDVWASWCAPCRTENREVLLPFWNKYHDEGLQIIGYGLESDALAWKAAVKRDGADRWPQVSDLQGDDAAFLKKIRIQTIPANFILDGRGVVVAKNVHGKDLTDWVKNHMEKK